MPIQSDPQATAIGLGLSELIDLLETPIAKSSLELGKNAEAAEKLSILKRLSRSLLQYLERDDALFYVGLIGHFSAGKTSTINSLLNVWNTAGERKTDFHPTDKTITLITREKNTESLIGMSKEGQVPIRLQKVESQVLDNVVLVDTPGTGDPELFQEIARDFLPICDVILFVFSAAAPLDANDVPLLKELHSRLQFIPIHFVVTRADELQLSKDAPFSETNVDAAKMHSFLDTAVTRVNTLLKPQVYQEASFTLIDNHTNFGIEALRTFISNRCDPASPQTHVSMHLNKLQYYKDGAKYLRTSFEGLLNHKLFQVTRIVDAAAKNIDRYETLVQISNNNLTRTWYEAASAIDRSIKQAKEKIRVSSDLPMQVSWFSSVSSKITEVKTENERDARYAAQSIISSAKSLAKAAVRDSIYILQKHVSDSKIQKLSASDTRLESPEAVIRIRPGDFALGSSLAARYGDLREAEIGALRDGAGELRRLSKDLEELSSTDVFVNETVEVIDRAKSSLIEDLNKFFQNVELYRTGVFSHTTKEAIATLGVGEKLDTLENEFTEDSKRTFSEAAIAGLFPNAPSVIVTAIEKNRKHLATINQAGESIRALKIEKPPVPITEIQAALDSSRSKFESQLTQSIHVDMTQFCADLNQTLGSAITSAKEQYDTKIRSLRSSQTRIYGMGFLLVAIFWGVGYMMLTHKSQRAPYSASGQLALALVGGALLEFCTFLFLRWWKSLPKLIDHTEKTVHDQLESKAKQLCDSALEKFQINSLAEDELVAKIRDVYRLSMEIDVSGWKAACESFLKSLRATRTQLMEVRLGILTDLDNFQHTTTDYFSDSDRNLSILTEVAKRIKEQAIEPSFDLLEATKNELQVVMGNISAIKFD
jgi:predicted GTPase